MLCIVMPPRRVRARGCARGRNPRGRGGHNNHSGESDPEVEQSHHGEDTASQTSNDGGPNSQGTNLKNWLELKAGDFHGTRTPMDAASWLSTMEKYMVAMELPSHKRVLFVAFSLKGPADDWWSGVRAAYPGEPTWAIFVQQFTTKYYPETFKEEMSEKLKTIKQGKLSINEYEAEFSKMVLFVDHVKHDEAAKARAFFRGLNSRYREVMSARPANDYLSMVKQARGMELEVRLTAAEEGRTGGSTGTGGDQKGSHRGGSGSTQRTSFKNKGNHRPQQTTKFKQSGSQPSSVSRFSSATPPLRLVLGQGLICFKCGDGHRASECTWTGECHHCGLQGHKGHVCRKNPDCIIKWESASSTPSVTSSRGSVHMLAAAPTSTPQVPPAWAPPHGYVWQAVPLASIQMPPPSAPLQLSGPPQHSVGPPFAPPQPVVYAMPTSASLGRPDVVTGKP
uniref:Uncharacterized protein n=1 Tax=Avena sativa TaxID=4498 RepID=A0ACD5UN03_AVESA